MMKYNNTIVIKNAYKIYFGFLLANISAHVGIEQF